MSTLEQRVADLMVVLGVAEGESRYKLGKANFYAIKADGTYRLVHSDGDVYEGFENLPNIIKLSDGDEGIAVETCGWAAPISENDDDDTAPSQHPKRRRVKLLSLITRTFETASALAFEDDDEIITDGGNASGAMAYAMIDTMRELVKNSQ